MEAALPGRPNETFSHEHLVNNRHPPSSLQDSTAYILPIVTIRDSDHLVIKWGKNVSIGEAQALLLMKHYLHGRITVPEVYGWRTDVSTGYTYIYMQLLPGCTYDQLLREGSLDKVDIAHVCDQLAHMMVTWQRDIPSRVSQSHPGLPDFYNRVYPFAGEDHGFETSKNYCDHKAGTDVDLPPPYVWSTGDFVPSNILLVKEQDEWKVSGVFDLEDAGWYPEVYDAGVMEQLKAGTWGMVLLMQ